MFSLFILDSEINFKNNLILLYSMLYNLYKVKLKYIYIWMLNVNILKWYLHKMFFYKITSKLFPLENENFVFSLWENFKLKDCVYLLSAFKYENMFLK